MVSPRKPRGAGGKSRRLVLYDPVPDSSNDLSGICGNGSRLG